MSAIHLLPEPRAYSQTRLALHLESAERLGRHDRALSAIRAAVFIAGAIVWYLVVGPQWLTPAWMLLPVVIFLVLVVVHAAAARRLRHAERAIALHRRTLERLDDKWAGAGENGQHLLDETHLYAADLDLFGTGSLFELLSRARTRTGEATLAGWLCAPAARAEVLERQAAIAELRGALSLREDWALVGDDVRAVNTEALVRWSGAAAPAPAGHANGITLALSALNVLAVAAWGADLLTIGPMLLLLAPATAWVVRLRPRLHAAHAGLERTVRNLQLLALLLARLERERFSSPRLMALRASLDTGDLPASREVARLVRLVELEDSMRNVLFAPLGALLLWNTHTGLAIESWRRRCGSRIGGWVVAIGEIEALSSLAGHAFEHPADPFPEIVDAGPCFDGIGIGHPLLPQTQAVRNDVRLDAELRLLLVSGSNMSGKSTLLRSVGTNLVLALAGAPVRAERLRVSALALGASIRVQDSLQAGRSRFYAEILRLRQIMQGAAAGPLLFLLDEVLGGTNSDDRRRGAEAVVRGLLARGAIGLVTTHDLALAQVVEALGTEARNVHFEDHIDADGQIAFDYLLREGVVQRSNAVALMRAVGLDV